MNRATKSTLISGGLALLMIPALAATASATTSMPGAAGSQTQLTEPSVLIFNQQAEGQSVLIRYVLMPKSGYVAIYGSDASSKPTGDPLGYVHLKSGDHREIKVELKSAVPSNTQLWAAMYEDKDGDAKLDKSKDQAFWAGSKLPWENKFQIE
jgi:hypothetical protein